jgi:hypothetical protein
MRNLVAVTFLLLFAAVATALFLQTALDPASNESGCPALKSRDAVSAQNPVCPYMQRGRCPYTHPRTALPQAAGRLRSLEI